MWECCQCLSNKTGTSVHCDVCGHSKCKACFEIEVPDNIKDENEQQYYFEVMKHSSKDISHSSLNISHLKNIQNELMISEKRSKEIVKIANVKVTKKAICSEISSEEKTFEKVVKPETGLLKKITSFMPVFLVISILLIIWLNKNAVDHRTKLLSWIILILLLIFSIIFSYYSKKRH